MSRFTGIPAANDPWWMTAPIAEVLEARIKQWETEARPGYCPAQFGGDCTCHFRAYGNCDCGVDYSARRAT